MKGFVFGEFHCPALSALKPWSPCPTSKVALSFSYPSQSISNSFWAPLSIETFDLLPSCLYDFLKNLCTSLYWGPAEFWCLSQLIILPIPPFISQCVTPTPSAAAPTPHLCLSGPQFFLGSRSQPSPQPGTWNFPLCVPGRSRFHSYNHHYFKDVPLIVQF